MKKTAKICLGILVIILLTGCSENLMTDPIDGTSSNPVLKSAKEMPSLVGETHEFLQQAGDYLWMGTIEFPEMDLEESYEIAYKILESSGDQLKIQHITEEFYIYPEGSDPEEGAVLSGTNSGITQKLESFVTNGKVELAKEPFEDWIGRSVHVRGIILFNPGPEIESTFRIN